jgi:hypothetical protein
MAKKHRGMMTGEPVTYQIPAPAGGVQMETFIPWTLVKRGIRQQVITPIDAPEHFQLEAVVERSARKQAKDSPLIRALGLAHYWQRLLDEGKYRSLTDIAIMERIDLGHASRIAQLARLAPGIVQHCLSAGRSDSKLDELTRACGSVTWINQASHIPHIESTWSINMT